MKRYVEFQLEGEGKILVEVDEPGGSGTVPAGRDTDLPEKARMSFEQALATVRPAAEAIIVRLNDLADPPDQVQVEFGLKLSGTAGAIIASAGVEANYKVTLTWKRGR